MDLEKAYFIGKLVSAVVVIISIFYLAIQERQNTHATKLHNFSAVSASYVTMLENLYSDPELLSIYLKGFESLDQLNEPEKARFVFITQHVVRIWHEYYT